MISVLLLAATVASFENDYVRFSVGDDGCVSSLYEKANKRELVKERTPFVAWIDAKGGLHGATSCTGDKDRLDFAFPDGESISLKVQPFNGGWTFETADAKLGDAASVWFVRLKPACAEYFGRFANAISDETSAVFVRGYEAKTEMYCADAVAGAGGEDHTFAGIPNGGNILCAGAVRKFGFDGHKAGLAVAPRSEILKVMREMTLVSGAPHSIAGGAWAMESEANRGSYLFATGLDAASVDDWIACAERGGFDFMHFHVWWKLYGSYEIDEKSFPGGYEELKASVAKARAAGLKTGTHTLSGCIQKGSACHTPECSTNLIAIWSYTLARPFKPGDTELYVNEPIWKNQESVFASAAAYARGRGNTLRIGRELLQYKGVSREKPYRFTGLTRGVFEHEGKKYPVKQGGPYAVGERIDYLRSVYDSFYPNPDSPMMDYVIGNIDKVYNACDMDEIYFDGSEGMGERYAVDRMRERIFRSLKQGPNGVVNEASCKNPYHWWFRSRLWPWDHNWYGAKRLHDLHMKMTLQQARYENFMGCNLGWWAPLKASPVNRGHFLDDMEYYGCKNAAYDVSMSMQGCYVTDGPLSLAVEKQITVLGWWERARMAKAFVSGLPERMQPYGAEFRLRQNDATGVWEVTPQTVDVHRAGDAWSSAWSVSLPKNARAELRVEALHGAKPFEAETSTAFLKSGAKLAVTTHADVTAAVTTGHDAKVGDTFVLTAENAGAKARGAWAIASDHHPYPDLIFVDNAFGCWVKGDGSGATLNLQLRLHRYNWSGVSEHYVKLDYTGWRYQRFIMKERDANASADFDWPYTKDWRTNRCIFNGPYWEKENTIEYVNVCLIDVPANGRTRVEFGEVRSLGLTSPRLEDAVVTVNGRALRLPFALETGDYAELADGVWELYDAFGDPKRRVVAQEDLPALTAGENRLSFAAKDPVARAEVTLFALETPVAAFRPSGERDAKWLAYEAVMPHVYAPSKGFDAPVGVAVRPGERAQLGVEIWGPVENPTLAIDGKRWTFPVKLAEKEHVFCRDGRTWKAVRVVPGKTYENAGEWYKIAGSQRETLAEGTLAEPLPVVTKPCAVTVTSADPDKAASRIEIFKRY